MMMRLYLAALVLLFSVGIGFAHPQLEKTIPPVGSTVAVAPPEIRIFFTQALNTALSNIALAADSGTPVAVGRAVVDGQQMAVKLPPLAPGKYRVYWHAVSTDSHELDGHYSFEVGH